MYAAHTPQYVPDSPETISRVDVREGYQSTGSRDSFVIAATSCVYILVSEVSIKCIFTTFFMPM